MNLHYHEARVSSRPEHRSSNLHQQPSKVLKKNSMIPSRHWNYVSAAFFAERMGLFVTEMKERK